MMVLHRHHPRLVMAVRQMDMKLHMRPRQRLHQALPSLTPHCEPANASLTSPLLGSVPPVLAPTMALMNIVDK
jgi:hypothetical protein